MRAVKHSPYIAASHNKKPRTSRDVDALLLAAESSACPNSFDRLNLLMLCAIKRKMSAQQRVVLIRLLVKSFVVATRYVPAAARPILVATELPPALERVAERIKTRTQTWLAWTDNRRTWFVVADMNTDSDMNGNAAAIRMLFYDESGDCAAAGTWKFNSHGKWKLDSVHVDEHAVVTDT